MRRNRLWMVIACAAMLAGANARADVDHALVGTWQLQGLAADILWVVRQNGDYRLHGNGARPPQRGQFAGVGGQWSVNAPAWADEGTYRLADANTWLVTSRLGTGTWKRVWAPGQPQTDGRGQRGVCDWLRPSEVAVLLAAPVSEGQAIGAQNQDTLEAIGGCRYTSRFGERVELEVQSTVNKPGNPFGRARAVAQSPIAVPGLGEEAYATVDGPRVHVRGKNRILILSLAITAGSAEDLAGLVALARNAYARIP